MVGKLHRVPLRDVWPHEAYDFTRWLQENVVILNEVTGLKLSNAKREQAAGSFSVDIVAEDYSGDLVVIENQLGRSNHDHLGKLLTYLVWFRAKVGIWIVAEPRPEHIEVISQLNETSSASFYLIKLEAVQIDDSEPAPLLTTIVGPERRESGKTAKEIAESDHRQAFLDLLLELARQRTALHANSTPHNNYINTGAGISGIEFRYLVRRFDADVDLYIDHDTGEGNRQLLEKLHAYRETIEESFGDVLEWEVSESSRACRIRKRIKVGGYRSAPEEWPTIQDALIDAMIRLEKALRPYLKKLN
ncbi:MAG: DUF4268 domain-containing protein [Anaerolineales bacterium]|nr:DUF4268 domain-containing protein [Anaerolineales bacterium]